jgi:myo-inositol-1(or 4)-monophosphatase
VSTINRRSLLRFADGGIFLCVGKMKPTLFDLENLARQAGALLRAGYGQCHQIDHKGVIDLVTEVDRHSEDYLIGEIHRRFPGHHILTEESGVLTGEKGQTWYIDPLDGTVNYAHGIPIFTVSVAYAEKGKVRLGVVYDPMRDECFTAERGGGARLNGQSLQVSSVPDLDQSLLVTGFPYDIRTTHQNNLDNYARLAVVSQGVRRLGSAALDLCYVAAGRFDGYWEVHLELWDLAAGGLIAQEAGAMVTNLQGNPNYFIPPISIVAANPLIHSHMLELLSTGCGQ